MRDSEALRELAAAIEGSGLIGRGSDGVVMLSGGADSACLAAGAVAVCGPEAVYGIHVNYGLREDSAEGERAARALCAKLRIDLHIERPRLGSGNLQARAREARLAAAEALRERLRAEWIATGHTRSDIAETMLYRLAVSPGTRALRTMAPRSGRLVRPLHRLPRERTRALAAEAELPFADDPTNATDVFARNRIRRRVIPELAEIGPELERNLAATHLELLEEAELLDALAAEAIAAAGAADGSPIRHEELALMKPALARGVLRHLAESAATGRPVAIDAGRTREIIRLAAEPEGGTVELGRGLRAICEAGTVRFATGVAPEPAAVELAVPGRVRFGRWELSARIEHGEIEPGGPEIAVLDADAAARRLLVRPRAAGDRIRPLGLEGSKSLQDLFVDAGVPRSLRGQLPVVLSEGRIAWVAGVAIGEEFRLRADSRRALVISATATSEPEPIRASAPAARST